MFELVQIGSTSYFFCFFNNYLLRFRTLAYGNRPLYRKAVGTASTLPPL